MISKTFCGYLLSLISVYIGFFFYFIGFNAIKWDNHFENVVITWDFWKYFFTLIVSLTPTLSTSLECVLFVKKNCDYTRIHLLLTTFSMIYFTILMAHELFILSFCNTFTEINVNGIDIHTPYYPQCINEDYPRNTYPSYGFLCRYFGIVCICLNSIVTHFLCYTYFKSISNPL